MISLNVNEQLSRILDVTIRMHPLKGVAQVHIHNELKAVN